MKIRKKYFKNFFYAMSCLLLTILKFKVTEKCKLDYSVSLIGTTIIAQNLLDITVTSAYGHYALLLPI